MTETSIDPDVHPLPSGVYRFKLTELDPEAPIVITPGGEDKRLITTFLTHNKEWAVGANGIGFDREGTMFVCNFGDAQLLKFKMEHGLPVGPGEVFAEQQGMESADGLKIDEAGNIYIADFLGNAVHKVDAKTGKVRTGSIRPFR